MQDSTIIHEVKTATGIEDLDEYEETTMDISLLVQTWARWCVRVDSAHRAAGVTDMIIDDDRELYSRLTDMLIDDDRELYSGLTDMSDIDDDEESTDVGESETSETESSFSFSSTGDGCSNGRRFRFGKASLETVTATQVLQERFGSPRGWSRDVCNGGVVKATTSLRRPATAEGSTPYLPSPTFRHIARRRYVHSSC